MERLLYRGKILEKVDFKDERELERIVVKNSAKIFGKQTVYFELKPSISESGNSGKKADRATQPDGFLLKLGSRPSLSLVEIELFSHGYDHIEIQLNKFKKALNGSKWTLVRELEQYLKKHPSEARLVKKMSGNAIMDVLTDAIMEREIPFIVVIDELDAELNLILNKFGVKSHTIQKFTNGGETAYHIDGLVEGSPAGKRPKTNNNGTGKKSESAYLRGKNTQKIWNYLQDKIASEIPHSEFHMTKFYGAFVVRAGSKKMPICGVTSLKNHLRLFYSTKPEDGVISVSEFIKDLGGKGHYYGGSDMASTLRSESDIDLAIPIIKKILEHKKSKFAPSSNESDMAGNDALLPRAFRKNRGSGPPMSEEKYLSKFPKIRDLWMYMKKQIEQRFPDAVFGISSIYGFYDVPGAKRLCWMVATGRKINLGYGVKVKDDILSESSFIRDVSGVGRHFSGEYQSSIKAMDDFDRALPFMEKVWRFKTCRLGRDNI